MIDIFSDRGTIKIPILSPNHYWQDTITKAGFMIQVMEALENQHDKEKNGVIWKRLHRNYGTLHLR